MENFLTILTIKHLITIGVVVCLSIVQSLFGVGLLVFGTPTLLLIGYPFDVTLSYLLPSSITISTIQVAQNWRQITLFKKAVPMYVLPPVVAGLVAILLAGQINLNRLIGITLIFTAIVRLSKKFSAFIGALIKKNLKLGLMLTGFIHGTTNLGGAPLTIVTNNIYTDKGSGGKWKIWDVIPAYAGIQCI